MAWNNFVYESNWSGTHPNWPKFLSTQGVACRWAGRVCDATIGTNSSIQRNSNKNVSRNTSAPEKKNDRNANLCQFPTYTHPKQHIQSAGSKWMHLFEFNDRGQLNHERLANCFGHFLSVIAPKRHQRHSEKVNVATPNGSPSGMKPWIDLIWFELTWHFSIKPWWRLTSNCHWTLCGTHCLPSVESLRWRSLSGAKMQYDID